LHRIKAGCAVENIASIKVLEKVGMIREGRGRQLLPLKSSWSDNFQYAILETDSRSSDLETKHSLTETDSQIKYALENGNLPPILTIALGDT
jgi:hypothetical protein